MGVNEPTIVISAGNQASPVAGDGTGDVSESLLAKAEWSDQDLVGHRIPIYDVPFVTVGGGLGSFAMVDILRIAGCAGRTHDCPE